MFDGCGEGGGSLVGVGGLRAVTCDPVGGDGKGGKG